ncbi:hypothetical protein X801_01010, partial [Opisthorchis viverrini]
MDNGKQTCESDKVLNQPRSWLDRENVNSKALVFNVQNQVVLATDSYQANDLDFGQTWEIDKASGPSTGFVKPSEAGEGLAGVKPVGLNLEDKLMNIATASRFSM